MSYYREAENLLNKQRSGLTDFIQGLKTKLNPESTLVVHLSAANMFRQVRFDDSTIIEKEEQLVAETDTYDLILADLPLNIKKVTSEVISNRKVNNNWDLLYKAIKLIRPKGYAFFVVEPAILFSKTGKKVLKKLEELGFVYCAAFNTPKNILHPITSFRPIMLAFGSEITNDIFIGEMGDENEQLVQNFISGTDTKNLESGNVITKAHFNSFSEYATRAQIDSLKKQYPDYVLYALKDVVVRVNKTKSKFQELTNSFYISRVGVTAAKFKLSPSDEPKYFFQIQVDKAKVLAEYIVLFYQSKLGQLILESLNTGSFIARISKSDLLSSTVAIPAMEQQKVLIKTSTKLRSLQDIINQLQQEIGLNPKNVNTILEKYDAIQEPLKALSVEDEVLGLIRNGEGKYLEFKQTFSRNIVTQKKDVGIQKASLKTIVGFLNASGGTLLIGVTDKGEITGVEQDLYNSEDSYLLHFRNTLTSKIGPEFYPHIDYDIVKALGKQILKVVCRPSVKPCFYDKKEFFVRTNPATDKLEGQQLVEYINNHFQ